MKKLLYLAWMLLALPLMAQVSNPSIIPVVSAPSGACSQVLPDQQTTVAGIVYTCQNGTWASIGSGGGGSLPTSTAIGDTLFATAASSTTYTARTNSQIPVELYGVTDYTSEALAEAGPDDTANFQAAVTGSIHGVATCQAGKWYHVDGPVNFISSEGLIGTTNQSYNALCGIVSNSATTHILSAVGSSGAFLSSITLANLNIRRSVTPTTTAADIYASFVGGMIVTNTLTYDGIYDIYRHATPSFGIGYWSHNQQAWLLGETTGTYYGLYDDSADGNAENSVITLHNATSCSGLSGAAIGYGQILTGEAVNDNVTWDSYTAGCSYGQVVNYTGSGGSFATNDIHFYGSTHDGIGVSCYKVTGTTLATDGFVEINGGHCNATVSVSPLADIENSYGVAIRGVDFNQHDTFGATHAIYAATDDHLIVANNTVTNFGTSTATSTPVEFTGVTHSSFTGNTVHARSTNAGNIFWITGNSTYNSVTGNTLDGFSTGGTGLGIDAGSNNNTYSGNAIDTTNITSATPIGDAGTNNNQITSNVQLSVTNTAAIAHVPLTQLFGPNATVGATCLVIDNLGLSATTNNDMSRQFGCVGTGSSSNWYGWQFGGVATYIARLYPNVSEEIGETTPAAGPANGLAVGTTGQATIDGSGNGTFAKVNVAAARKGTFVCTAAGTITIANANTVLASDVVITLNTPGGTPLQPNMQTKTAATGFTVLCGAADTSTYNYDILN